MAQSISQEAIGATGLPGATAASRHAGATTSGAPTTGTFAVGDFIVDQSGSTWICTASSQTASATTASGNGSLITFTASNSFSPGQYVNVTGFSNTGYNVSNAVIGSASSTQFTVVSSATGTTTGTGTAVTTGTWQLSGVSVNENIAGKNFIINGGMDIWQRGTSFTSLSSAGSLTYGADRWGAFRGAGATGINVSQVTSPGITGFQYAQRVQRASGNTATNPLYITQTIETRNSIPLAGQSVSVSFWARAGSNFSSASNNLTCYGQWGTGTDENLYNGFAGLTTCLTGNSSLTTSWQRFTYTGVISSSSTEVGLEIGYIPTGTAGANDYFDITGVQLEIAPQATPFSRAGGSIGGELALCQRYYQRIGGSYYSPENVGVGTAGTTTAGYINCPTKQVLRTGASFNAVFGASSMKIANAGGTQFAMTSASLAVAGTNAVLFSYNVASGLTAGQPVLCFITGTDAYIELNAEL